MGFGLYIAPLIAPLEALPARLVAGKSSPKRRIMDMFAVIRTGGKQYRVAPNDIIEVEKIAGQPGDIVELAEVLLLGGEKGPQTGSPTISGALVAAEVLEQKRADKIIVFK